MIEAEAVATLSGLLSEKYVDMVTVWRAIEPPGFFGRYVALRNRRREAGREPAG